MNNNIKLRKAQEADKNALKNLFQLYLHDLSEYTINLDVNTAGVFENNDVDVFYEKDALMPLMIEDEGNMIGFVMLNMPPYTPGACDYYIHDFFVLRKYRGRGFGKAAVCQLFQTYQGKFALMQLAKNHPAISFWKHIFTANGFCVRSIEIMEGDDQCCFQTFQVL